MAIKVTPTKANLIASKNALVLAEKGNCFRNSLFSNIQSHLLTILLKFIKFSSII